MMSRSWGATACVVLIVIAAVVLIGGQASLARPDVGIAAQDAAAQALISKLAVLRRPQTPADVLPPYAHFSGAAGARAIIPTFTRLVATRPGAELFIVVTTPAPGSPPLWSPKFGDQVAVVAVTADGSTESPAIPAVDLTNADTVVLVGVTGEPAHPSLNDAYEAAIVPDGVAAVRWTFGDLAGKRRQVVEAQTANNVAVVPPTKGSGALLGAAWYAPDGQEIPTSQEALRRAIAARDAVLSARIVRYDARHSHGAPPALLADFAVFAVTSRTGVRTAAGNIISHPRLSSVPLPILGLTEPDRTHHGFDPEEMRQVITRSGVEIWITPGRQGICLTVLEPPRVARGISSGSFGSCSANLAQAEAHGAGVTSGNPCGVTKIYDVVPKSKTITIRTRRGTRNAIYPPDGVYVGQTPACHR
jgi:hypothetical protein